MNTILTLSEVARFLRVHPSTVYRLLKHNDIPAFKVGADYRFSREAIESWMRERSASFVRS
jgi:excisionase family DNA binding protein